MQILSKTIKIKNLQIDIVLLWRISDVKQGLATGNNREYVFKEPDAVGPYRIIEPKNVLDETDINKIINDEELRIKIINDGISKKMFKGKTLVTLDKGGSSDIEEGRLSNYYAPTKFYIDWSEKSVRQMKTMTIAGWKKYYGEKNIPKSDENKIAAVLRNIDYYFKPGITFSPTGLYAPTFRLNTLGIFDHAGDGIFVKNEMKNTFSNEFLLGILCSKFTRYIQKNFLNNSVGVQVEDIKRNPIPICDKLYKNKIELLVKSIIKKQKYDLAYDYQNNEQIKIDSLIYDVYGLSSILIEEIENWYLRKYPKLLNN